MIWVNLHHLPVVRCTIVYQFIVLQTKLRWSTDSPLRDFWFLNERCDDWLPLRVRSGDPWLEVIHNIIRYNLYMRQVHTTHYVERVNCIYKMPITCGQRQYNFLGARLSGKYFNTPFPGSRLLEDTVWYLTTSATTWRIPYLFLRSSKFRTLRSHYSRNVTGVFGDSRRIMSGMEDLLADYGRTPKTISDVN